MKLQNKKTGEIVEPYLEWCSNSDKPHSLAELNEEWEDYEEPNEYYYYIDDLGVPSIDRKQSTTIEMRKNFGNYFANREEAEKAVEKLKAWKLLKDECDIKFDGIISDDKARLKAVKLTYDRHTVTFTRMRECMDALHLLFGCEE